jgi:hypothetical protein
MTPEHFRTYNSKKTEGAFFWAVAPCSLVVENQSFGRRAATIFRAKIHNQGDVYTEQHSATTQKITTSVS